MPRITIEPGSTFEIEVEGVGILQIAVTGSRQPAVKPVKAPRKSKPAPVANAVSPKKRTMSPEGRARIAASAKRRWKLAKKQGKKTL